MRWLLFPHLFCLSSHSILLLLMSNHTTEESTLDIRIDTNVMSPLATRLSESFSLYIHKQSVGWVKRREPTGKRVLLGALRFAQPSKLSIQTNILHLI